MAVNGVGVLQFGLFRPGMRRSWALRRCVSEAPFPGKRWLVSEAWFDHAGSRGLAPPLPRSPRESFPKFLVSAHPPTFKILGCECICVHAPRGCQRATWELVPFTIWISGIEPSLSARTLTF